MWENILVNPYINILELMAAISGIIYLKRVKPKNFTRVLILFLWITVFVELIAEYAAIAYYSNYSIFPFVKDTPFERNYWLYNIFNTILFPVFIFYFRTKLNSKKFRLITDCMLIIFLLASISFQFFQDWFFISHNPVTWISGTLVLLMVIGFFYLELLNSPKILSFYKLLPFYISVGLVIFYLSVTPLFIYSTYFKGQNSTYIRLDRIVLAIANTVLYGMFIIGFLKTSFGIKKI